VSSCTRALRLATAVVLVAGISLPIAAGADQRGGPTTATDQNLTPAGRQVQFPGRPTQVALRPDGKTAAVLNAKGDPLTVIDLAAGTVVGGYGAGDTSTSYDGLAYSHAGSTLYSSYADGDLGISPVNPDGTLGTSTAVSLGTTNPVPGGLAVSPDDNTVYVALSATNSLGIFDVVSQSLTSSVPVGNVPHAVVVSTDGTTAYVSNQGGRPALPGDTTDDSYGTAIVTDDPTQSGSSTGTVSIVDLASKKQVAAVPVGLQPTGMALSGNILYVANTNSDSVSVIDTTRRQVIQTIAVTPFPQAPFGSSPNGVTVLPHNQIAVSLGRNNAVAVYQVKGRTPAKFLGLLPTGAYPASVATDNAKRQLVVPNNRGEGNRDTTSIGVGGPAGYNTLTGYHGTVSLIPFPSLAQLQQGTAQVSSNNGWDGIDAICGNPNTPPVAIPLHLGDPSLIKHVIYVTKENRTYDQVLGDDPRGNGDPSFAQFGDSTPNQHALAQRFPLFDNFYDSGQLSADGHNWVVQGDVPDYVEKSFGDFVRSYPASGLDALAYLPSGFIWEDALRHGETVEDFGEYANYESDGTTDTDVRSLQPLLDPNYAGFALQVPDVQRMSEFKQRFDAHVANNDLPDLTLMTIPNDHTAGYNPLYPEPNPEVLDNDVAVGQLVDIVSHSQYWDSTAIFIVEDDSQNGLDHVDGHRTPIYVVSPYAKPGYVDHTYYTQVDMLRTVEQILGLPPMNQMDLAATPMRDAFTNTPDDAPYDAIPASAVSLPADTQRRSLTGHAAVLAGLWAQEARHFDLTEPDAVDANVHNHVDWYAAHGFSQPYPGERKVLTPTELLHGLSPNVAGVVAESQGAVADPEDAVTADGRSAAAAAEAAHLAVRRAQAKAAGDRLPEAQQQLVRVSRGGYTCDAATDMSGPGNSGSAPRDAAIGLLALAALSWLSWRRRPRAVPTRPSGTPAW
jgi:YVTN family beta-propeller protein